MKPAIKITNFAILLFMFIASVHLSGCDKENLTEPASMTDDEYLTTVAINTAFSTDADDDDNLFANEVLDFDSEGPVEDNGSGFDTPIDSLKKWGRRITGVNVNTSITTIGDTIKNVTVTRTISGNFIIVGYINGNLDSTLKPYSQQQKRLVTFKRIQRKSHPRFNWIVYQYTAVDGETQTPQSGKSNIVINKVEIYRNNNLLATLNGPDFTSNVFTSKLFGGNGLIEFSRNDQVRLKVFVTSNQNDTDIVSYHWARNSFGFHRERFVMTSQTPNGSNFDRTYEKTFQIYSHHNHGKHNAFLSADTRKSLYDNSPSLFSSTYMGFPYRVRP